MLILSILAFFAAIFLLVAIAVAVAWMGFVKQTGEAEEAANDLGDESLAEGYAGDSRLFRNDRLSSLSFWDNLLARFDFIEILNARMAQAQQCDQITVLLHKPVGYVSGQPERGYKPAISLINRESQLHDSNAPSSFSPSNLRGMAPAGRLDIDSSGLLVFTQDGRIARKLIGAESENDSCRLFPFGPQFTCEIHHGE